ncbi:MAG TPA: tetratricopeptide repeat protein [Thermoanaerobaculia bacterium]|jgi:tetratricopeptide (TPR) repeat protein|nr:tetratricopeptide repeat protein [Thermoanaerobaculia bacterium]
MSVSDSHVAAGTSRYPRSAHATIRGYLYQTCLGVLRWLDLQPNEILLCEGDEDLDRFILGGGSVSEQVKAYSGKLSLSDHAVLDSLRGFLQSYVTLRQNGEARSFVFTTTASPSRQQRKSGLDFDLLEAWRNGVRARKVLKGVRTLLINEGKKDKKDTKDNKKDKFKESVDWLDGQPDGWRCFVDAVKWTFDAPDLDAIRQTIRNRLAAREDTRLLPAETFLQRLVVRVLDASIQKDPRGRTLTPKDLSDLLASARTDLGAWAASSQADRIRTVFDEVGQIHRLLVDGTAPLPENPAPGKLLTAAYEVIPFDESGRREELDFLASWCDRGLRRSVLLLTGEGGSGKSRLMIEWCRRLRHQGWHAGFLRRDRDEKDLDPLLEGSAPRLVVVDYAETRIEVVQPLVLKAALASQGEGPKFRLVLLARRQADWWDSLSREDHEVGDLLGNSPSPRVVTPLIPQDNEERLQAFRVAVEGFGRQLRQSIPAGLKEPDLSGRDFGRALYLHMAALAALQSKRIETAEDALKETLDHERRFWDRQVRDVETNKSMIPEVTTALASAVAALTLIGGAASAEQADSLLRRVLKPFSLSPHHPRTVLLLLRRLYGSAEQSSHHLEPLQPDLLGEELVAETLPQDRKLLDRVLDERNPEEGYSTLTVLTRLSRRRPELRNWIGTALQGRLESLAELALNVAVETGDPIGLALVKEIEERGSIDAVLLLQKLCDEERYQKSVPLREVAYVTTEKGFLLLREQRTDLDESQQAELARLANNLGSRLSDLGRPEDALRATQEAVDIGRQLTQTRPAAFLPIFATSLNNLGNRLSDLGRREEALGATQESVEIYRRLSEIHPDAFLLYLARSLNNLGNRLSDLGRREEALGATQESVEIYRRLSETHPDAFLPDLATSLNHLGIFLSDLGRREEALGATQESVEIYRRLSEPRPDAFLLDLASSLNNMGANLNYLGRREDALGATEEAVELYRQLAQTRPDAFLPDLATSLSNLGAMLEKLGRREEALRATREAVDIRRRFCETRPDVLLPQLALSLHNLGSLLSDLGRPDEAFLAGIEAVRTLAPFFLHFPAAFAAWMVTMVQTYRKGAEAAGKEPDADLLGPIEEALQALSPSQDSEE